MSKKKILDAQTEQGHPPKNRSTQRAFADTLPVSVRKDASDNHRHGEGEADIFTSAATHSNVTSDRISGSTHLGITRIPEPQARELIVHCMAQAGIQIAPDHPFSYGNLLVTLDGFDALRRIGYQYISHSDVDVVTDFDASVEARIEELNAQGIVNILVIHDYNAKNSQELLGLVERFLARLTVR